ncbi:S-layer homology domain-containing protein [Bacillus sp. Marseille-P3661]|uniref:S-layer homology domain-containing protein n=1 Tax=Bacillus sp. Marseille-P3661 TaxID=1936234 RepID=UPI0015E17B90|nr:S-layer homology domain-containing protein [Bacillus sp. Marseille-P3661]
MTKRKALQSTLATSIAVSAVFSVAAPSLASAEDTTPRYTKLENNINLLMPNLRDWEKQNINTVLSEITVISPVWNDVFANVTFAGDATSKKDAIKLITVTVIDMLNGELSGTSTESAAEKWTNFKLENSTNLETLFGSDWELTLDQLFDFIAVYYSPNHLENTMITIMTSNLDTSQITNEILAAAKTAYGEENSAALDSKIQQSLSISLDDFFGIYENVISETDDENLVQDALTSSLFRYKGGKMQYVNGDDTTTVVNAVNGNTFTKDNSSKDFIVSYGDDIANISELLQVLKDLSITDSNLTWDIENLPGETTTLPSLNDNQLTFNESGSFILCAKIQDTAGRTHTVIQEKITIQNPLSNSDNTDSNSSNGNNAGGVSTQPTTPPDDATGNIEKVTLPNGVVKVVAKADETKIAELISKGELNEKVAITISKAQNEVAEAVISTNAIAALVAYNPNTVIEIATTEGKYELPAKEINIDSLANQLGVSAENVEVSIAVNAVEYNGDALADQNLQSVAPVLEFTIHARSGDKSLEIDKFTQYINRSVTASKSVNPNQIVAVRLNHDGSLAPVPTLANGKDITFKSRSNSMYTVVENDVSFADIEGSWARNDITTLANKLIIKGVDDQNFAPKAETTRAELAILLTRALGLQGQQATKVSFKDVKGNEWFAKDLAVAAEAGLVGGYEDGTFKANQTVTRQEAAAMIKRAMDYTSYDPTQLKTFVSPADQYSDYNEVGDWAKGDVEIITQAGIMSGDDKGTFNPTDNTTREQLASILKRFMTFVKFTN